MSTLSKKLEDIGIGALTRTGNALVLTGAEDVVTPPEKKPMPTAAQTIAKTVFSLISTVSIGASIYHGYRRNNGSLGWGLGWGFLGAVFPVITPAVALAQGFGKPAVNR